LTSSCILILRPEHVLILSLFTSGAYFLLATNKYSGFSLQYVRLCL
jgi:hypothetical protein